MIHTRTKIVALVSLALFLAALALCVGFSVIVRNHKNQLNEERLRAAQAEVEARALSELEETVRSSKDDREKLNSFILKDEAIIDLLSLIEQTALDQGVELTTESLTVGVIDDTFEELQVTVAIEGSFDGVMRMLRILESIPEQSFVPRVALSRAGGESGTSWNAQVEIRVTKYKKI